MDPITGAAILTILGRELIAWIARKALNKVPSLTFEQMHETVLGKPLTEEDRKALERFRSTRTTSHLQSFRR